MPRKPYVIPRILGLTRPTFELTLTENLDPEASRADRVQLMFNLYYETMGIIPKTPVNENYAEYLKRNGIDDALRMKQEGIHEGRLGRELSQGKSMGAIEAGIDMDQYLHDESYEFMKKFLPAEIQRWKQQITGALDGAKTSKEGVRITYIILDNLKFMRETLQILSKRAERLREIYEEEEKEEKKEKIKKDMLEYQKQMKRIQTLEKEAIDGIKKAMPGIDWVMDQIFKMEEAIRPAIKDHFVKTAKLLEKHAKEFHETVEKYKEANPETEKQLEEAINDGQTKEEREAENKEKEAKGDKGKKFIGFDESLGLKFVAKRMLRGRLLAGAGYEGAKEHAEIAEQETEKERTIKAAFKDMKNRAKFLEIIRPSLADPRFDRQKKAEVIGEIQDIVLDMAEGDEEKALKLAKIFANCKLLGVSLLSDMTELSMTVGGEYEKIRQQTLDRVRGDLSEQFKELIEKGQKIPLEEVQKSLDRLVKTEFAVSAVISKVSGAVDELAQELVSDLVKEAQALGLTVKPEAEPSAAYAEGQEPEYEPYGTGLK